MNGLAEKVKKAFDLPFVLVYGPGLMDKEVKRAALCPGSGSSVIEQAVLAGADVLITGDIGHHPGIDAAARELAVIDGGHYGLEHIFIQHMAEVLREKLKVRQRLFWQSRPGRPFFYRKAAAAYSGSRKSEVGR